MSVTKLQAARDQVEKDGIGVYLPVVKTLFSAIDEHISEDNADVENSLLQVKYDALEKASNAAVAQAKQNATSISQQQGLIHDLKSQIAQLQSDLTTAQENAQSYLNQIAELSKVK